MSVTVGVRSTCLFVSFARGISSSIGDATFNQHRDHRIDALPPSKETVHWAPVLPVSASRSLRQAARSSLYYIAPSGLRSGAPKGDRASPPCCSRAGVRAASRGPISKSTNTSKVEYAGSERPGIRLSDPVAFVGVFTRRDEFFLGPLTLASLRGEFSYWCT